MKVLVLFAIVALALAIENPAAKIKTDLFADFCRELANPKNADKSIQDTAKAVLKKADHLCSTVKVRTDEKKVAEGFGDFLSRKEGYVSCTSERPTSNGLRKMCRGEIYDQADKGWFWIATTSLAPFEQTFLIPLIVVFLAAWRV